ncbi:MAG: alpha-galactosidase [Clostridia bacterium]|nr:alpha-galactosidase [Clostridia bacterium]
MKINASEKLTKKEFVFGDMVGVFATVNNVTQFLLVPRGTEGQINDEKLCCICPLGQIIHSEPMLHIALSGDGYSCDYTAGSTQRNSDTASSLCLVAHTEEELADGKRLVSAFENQSGLRVNNVLEYRGGGFLTTYNEIVNVGEELVLEAAPSFNLSCISPFERYNDSESIVLHKLMSHWSGEGRKYSVSTDKLGFEHSWSGLGIRMEKWCQTGSMPARNQLPFVAVEDKKKGVVWAATIEAPSSWEIETVFRNGNLSIGGGQSDFLTGHWRKTLKNGEKFTTRKAFITVAKGGLETACERLLERFDFEQVKACEQSLPVMYNEWCASWGNPRSDELEMTLPIAKELGCKYFVVDDGWFYDDGKKILGDWEVSEKAFPNGLGAFSRTVQKHGMTFGVWYEFERVTVESDVFQKHPDWMLTYDGKIIVHQNRAFFDFRKPEVIEYLREKVIKALKENSIGYMKVDYNDNIGLGVDGAESYGEGLREHINAVIAFFEEIKRELPDLVLEVCASGGMRHEPKFLSLGDMVSFSDAHECAGGVCVALDLHRFIPPRKMQIWATIRDEYTAEDVRFTCAKAMLGRFCLSGKLVTKSPEILFELKRATEYYKTVSHIVASGRTTVIENGEIHSYFKPEGGVYLVRESLDKREKLVYAFSMDKPNCAFKIEVGSYSLKSAFNAPDNLSIENGVLTFTGGSVGRWGCVLHLTKK